MNFLKAYIRRKATYYKSYYYRNSFIPYNFKERYELISNLPIYKTSEKILFKGKVPFDINIKSVESIIGKAHFVHSDENINNYITIYYKNKLNDIKNKSQLHFFNNQFFYGIQIFPYLTSIQEQEFFELLRIKYQFPSSANPPVIVKDENESFLIISINLGLTLEYITGNTALIKQVFDVFKQLELQKVIREEKRRQLILNSI